MANTRDIRRRIRSVKNTSQITRAMQLVAAAKMKKAQDQALAGRAFAERLNKTINNLKARPEGLDHPFLGTEEIDSPAGEATETAGKELLIVVNTDKGLCGGLNTNLLKVVLAGSSEDTDYVTVGKKLRATLARMNRNIVADFPIVDPVDFASCKQVAKFVSEKFLEGEYTTIKVAFSNFVNTLRQEPVVETLLPVNPIELGAQKDYEGVGDDDAMAAAKDDAGPSCPSYLFEPSPKELLDVALPMFVNYQVYQMVLESRASEHSARMVAMKSATDNAKQLVKDLTLQYNKVRQAAITNELLEITTAMKALE